MNKRIQKLFNEAGFHQPEMERLGIEDKFEKFAELIVRECMDVTDAHTEVFQTDRDKALIEHIKQSVKTHFGVEE